MKKVFFVLSVIFIASIANVNAQWEMVISAFASCDVTDLDGDVEMINDFSYIGQDHVFAVASVYLYKYRGEGSVKGVSFVDFFKTTGYTGSLTINEISTSISNDPVSVYKSGFFHDVMGCYYNLTARVQAKTEGYAISKISIDW